MLPTFTNQDYEVIDSQIIHQGFLRMMRYQFRYRLFKGGFSKIVTRELMERPSAIAILLYDPILDHIVFIEQFRPGATNDPRSPWLLEAVAGIIGPDETPENVAKRESHEEAGCEVLDLYPICEYFVSPGGTNEYLWLFCGRVDASEAGGIHGLHDEDEDIRVVTLPFAEACNLLKQGLLKTSPAIISIQWLQLNREWLRNLWQIK